MQHSEILEAGGIVAAVLCVLAIIKWRRYEFVPIHWLVFAALGLGAIGVSFFYYEVDRGFHSIAYLINLSRILWGLSLLLTSLVAVSVLVHKRR